MRENTWSGLTFDGVGSFTTTDRDAASDLYVGVRTARGWVALSLSILRDGDIAIICPPDGAARLAAALRAHAGAADGGTPAASVQLAFDAPREHDTAEVRTRGDAVELYVTCREEWMDHGEPDRLGVALAAAAARRLAGLLDEAAQRAGSG